MAGDAGGVEAEEMAGLDEGECHGFQEVVTKIFGGEDGGAGEPGGAEAGVEVAAGVVGGVGDQVEEMALGAEGGRGREGFVSRGRDDDAEDDGGR